MMILHVARCRLAGLLAVTALAAGCQQMPTSGPTHKDMNPGAVQAAGIQFVDVDAGTVARLQASHRRFGLFSEAFSEAAASQGAIGKGDVLDFSIWEAPPATLFGGGAQDPRSPSTARATTLPEQVVDREGYVSVPFAGRFQVLGLTPSAVEAEVVRRLKGKANQPEVLVRLVRNNSATVTVVGEVANSVRMPLTAGGERVLDALAAAGGVRQPVHKMTLQLSRGGQSRALPLDQVIRDPNHNIALRPGDVLTARLQPLSFTTFGATGKNEEISSETQGISLGQALARAGGLQDTRAAAQGVFIFRLEQEDALDWPNQPVAVMADKRVPVVYRFDLTDPRSFLTMQRFLMADKDVLYVSNSPASDLQKFLNMVMSVIYPLAATRSLLP